jgi:predicted nucleic-acid-binding protein
VIGLDTNVLVRYLTQDDPAQSKQATRLIEKVLTPAVPGFVSLVVLVELFGVLTQRYRVTNAEWLDLQADLLNGAHFLVKHRDSVQAAALVCRSHSAGFVDALIAQVAGAAGCTRSASFDKAAIRLAGVKAF